MEFSHIPVMVEEMIKYLAPDNEGIYVDCTLGSGGHTESILRKGGGKVIGIDQDEAQVKRAGERLKRYGRRATLIHDNFVNLKAILQSLNISQVEGIIFDLGVSFEQLGNSSRGFSFQLSGPLDMRLDRRNKITASDLVNNLSLEHLRKLILDFGQERWARRIACSITRERERAVIRTTGELVELIARAVPRQRKRRIHPATRTFQALRIAVNNELEILNQSLPPAIDLLSKKGRILVISFHSLEDRIAKVIFREAARSGRIDILTKKPLVPSLKEKVSNPRARSAKLRGGEKII